MNLAGVDSAFGPSPAVAAQAKAFGIVWWGCYVGGPGAYHVWSPTEVEVIQAAGILPRPLWVPSMGLLEDPVQAAADAVGAMEALGMYGSSGIDTEEAMIATGRVPEFVTGFVDASPEPVVYAGAKWLPANADGWFPFWGESVMPASSAAVQYGPATRFGMSVDVDLAGPTFPLASWTPPPKEKPAVPTLNAPIVAIAPLVDIGYWLVAADGGVFPFGAAVGRIDLAKNPLPAKYAAGELVRPIVGAEVTLTGNGLLLVAGDGGVFTLGDAAYHGSIPAEGLAPA